MYQGVVFFDFESYVVANNQKPVPSFFATIQQLKQKGILPVILANVSLQVIQKVVPKEIVNSYILYDGQLIIVEGYIIYKKSLKQEVIHELEEICTYLNDSISKYGKNQSFLSKYTPVVKHFQEEFFYEQYKTIVSDERMEEIYLLRIFYHDHRKDLVYQTFFDKQLFSFREDYYSLQIKAVGHSFQQGVHFLLQFFGMDKDNKVYTVCDSLERVEIFEKTVGICTKKAPIRVQVKATYSISRDEQLKMIVLSSNKK